MKLKCIKNAGYKTSLEVGKTYEAKPSDAVEALAGLVRVIDESGEDYLYPKGWFEDVP